MRSPILEFLLVVLFGLIWLKAILRQECPSGLFEWIITFLVLITAYGRLVE